MSRQSAPSVVLPVAADILFGAIYLVGGYLMKSENKIVGIVGIVIGGLLVVTGLAILARNSGLMAIGRIINGLMVLLAVLGCGGLVYQVVTAPGPVNKQAVMIRAVVSVAQIIVFGYVFNALGKMEGGRGPGKSPKQLASEEEHLREARKPKQRKVEDEGDLIP